MATTELSFPNSYNRELILDLTLQAFSVYDFDYTGAPRLHDYVPVPKTVKTDETTEVLDQNGVVVTDAAGADVTVVVKVSSNRTQDRRKENFKYLTTSGASLTLSEYRDYSFTDFISVDSVGFDFDSYLITGHDFSQDFMRKKQAIYLVVLCKRTETKYTLVDGAVALARQSSCIVQARWEWHDTDVQGKFGTGFEAYRFLLPQPSAPASGDDFTYGATVITTKNKLRGSGDALSLLFKSSTGKDLKLLGWGILGYKVDEP